MTLRLVANDGDLIKLDQPEKIRSERSLRSYTVMCANKDHECKHWKYCRFGGFIQPGESYEAKVVTGWYKDLSGVVIKYFYVTKVHMPDCFDDYEWIRECEDENRSEMEDKEAENATSRYVA